MPEGGDDDTRALGIVTLTGGALSLSRALRNTPLSTVAPVLDSTSRVTQTRDPDQVLDGAVRLVVDAERRRRADESE